MDDTERDVRDRRVAEGERGTEVGRDGAGRLVFVSGFGGDRFVVVACLDCDGSGVCQFDGCDDPCNICGGSGAETVWG